MSSLIQNPAPGTRLLACAGDLLEVTLRAPQGRAGDARLRTNLGRAEISRGEIVAHTEEQRPFLAADWHDLPMTAVGDGLFRVRVPLCDTGRFAAKACFIPGGASTPEWPEGDNLHIKVAPAFTACANCLYTAFVRQFGPALRRSPPSLAPDATLHRLDAAGYAVIPPSGTFRSLMARLDTIIVRLGCRILQLLPIHPVPTTFARMGRFGSPFACLDLFAVDPALAEFDRRATPLDQFRELVDAVHARHARIMLDLPANHTGWASTLQAHHPEWFDRNEDGSFRSPGAWGTVWEDLVQLDHRHAPLHSRLAEVFLFWCRQGVDGFRCDAGYMIPCETWRFIVARVRQEHPDTLFLLEGLGGKLEVTERLLTEANMDWAYSEIFQMEDRAALERYLPSILALSGSAGPLIHFAETHDNNRLAARGETYARMRTALAALLSDAGAFGIANGVEWLATAKIDVHDAAPLNWGTRRNQVRAIARLNSLLAAHPAFAAGARVRLVQLGGGNVLAARREKIGAPPLLALVNLDCAQTQSVAWRSADFHAVPAWDLLSGEAVSLASGHGESRLELAPGQVRCLSGDGADCRRVAERRRAHEPEAIERRRRNLLALRVRHWLGASLSLPDSLDVAALGAALARDPYRFCATKATDGRAGAASPALPRVATWNWPADQRRVVMLPPGFLLLVRAPHPFRVRLESAERAVAGDESIALGDGSHATLLQPAPAPTDAARAARNLTLHMTLFPPAGVQHGQGPLLALAEGAQARARLRVEGAALRADGHFTVLANGRGAMAQVRGAWGTIRSQYDALLAVNLNPQAPDNRRVFFTRCRAWAVHCGYSHALDAACTEWFEADPAGTRAAWRFRTPIGMGRRVAITLSLSLTSGRNRAVLDVTRAALAGETEALADDDPITVVLRPDIEARDFHAKTQAFTGPEIRFPAAVRQEADGFLFQPSPAERYRLHAEGGHFHAEQQWSYGVPHPEDAERGLGGQSDLFSPGWFGIELRGGQRARLTAAAEDGAAPASDEAATLESGPETLPLEKTLRHALNLFIVARGTRRTVIAGYPWFLDWGRDTLIVLRGLIAAGRGAEALDILAEFGSRERQGTLPNMLRGADDANRDTSDAPLWFAVAVRDAAAALGAAALETPCGDRPLRAVLLSIARHYRDGTPNGIRCDRASGLIYSPPHFTWMDTNYPAATPRGGYPIEIQALWIATLNFLRERAGIEEFASIENQARTALERYFVLPEGWLADCLRAPPGVAAAAATPEDALRPNQLLAVTLGAIAPREALAREILRACETLLVPGAMRTLADRPVRVPQPVPGRHGPLNDPHNPYWGRYLGDEDTRRKPAYHNGTAWLWPFPLYCEGLLKVYGAAARAPALALLSSTLESLNSGCIGQLPEILDGDAPHHQRGCGAQAWSVSELLRVWRLCAAP